MRNPFFAQVSNALDAADRLPDQVGKGAYVIRQTGDQLNTTLKVVAVLLFGILTALILGMVR